VLNVIGYELWLGNFLINAVGGESTRKMSLGVRFESEFLRAGGGDDDGDGDGGDGRRGSE